MTDRLFIDQDGDACLEPHDREDNLVALPARDDDGNILNPETWERMVRAFNEADTAIPRAEADAMVAAAYLDAEDALASADQEQADDGITWGDMSQIVDAIASRTPADARAAFEKAVQEAVEAALQQATLFCTDCGHPVPAGPDGRGSCGHGRVMRISTLVQHEIGGKND